MTIKEIYEKYQHLDFIITDSQWSDEFYRHIILELWQTIKQAMTQNPSVLGLPKFVDILDELYEASRGSHGGLYQEDVTAPIRDTLAWMCQDLNYRREQTGLESAPLSPEMQLAQKLLEELRTGRIICRKAHDAVS